MIETISADGSMPAIFRSFGAAEGGKIGLTFSNTDLGTGKGNLIGGEINIGGGLPVNSAWGASNTWILTTFGQK